MFVSCSFFLVLLAFAPPCMSSFFIYPPTHPRPWRGAEWPACLFICPSTWGNIPLPPWWRTKSQMPWAFVLPHGGSFVRPGRSFWFPPYSPYLYRDSCLLYFVRFSGVSFIYFLFSISYFFCIFRYCFLVCTTVLGFRFSVEKSLVFRYPSSQREGAAWGGYLVWWTCPARFGARIALFYVLSFMLERSPVTHLCIGSFSGIFVT